MALLRLTRSETDPVKQNTAINQIAEKVGGLTGASGFFSQSMWEALRVTRRLRLERKL